MLLHDFLQVPLPSKDIDAIMEAEPHAIVVACAQYAYDNGRALGTTIGTTASADAGTVRLKVRLGTEYRDGQALEIPFEWMTFGADVLFLRLDGVLEVMPVGPDDTQLNVVCRCDLPLGEDQEPLPSATHAVIESVLRSFLRRLSEHFATLLETHDAENC